MFKFNLFKKQNTTLSEEDQKPELKEKTGVDLDFVVMPPSEMPEDLGQDESTAEMDGGRQVWQARLKLFLIVFLGLLVLGGGGYLVYSKFFKNKQGADTEALQTGINVPPPENKNVDSDNDGLTDTEEKNRATDPKKTDSDGDGLADGDEINIYQTDPLLKDSDNDSFDDGLEIASGYSPIIKAQKATSLEVQSWTEKIAKYTLHEPSKTTLQIKANPAKLAQKTIYLNGAYKYSIELPAVLTYREGDEGNKVGIYIAGTEPGDADITSDPINLTIAVKAISQTIEEWIASQYHEDSYKTQEQVDISGVKSVKLRSVSDEVCPKDQTFIPKDNRIVVITWTCNQNSPFADLYEQIVQSFKFNK